MKVSVVIPVYNQCQLTERCLQSLLKHSKLLGEVTVVDNASRDNTALILNDFKEQFTQTGVSFQVISNSENVGFGRACNQGIRIFLKDQAQYLVILNNDTWLMPDWDQALVDTLNSKHLDCVGPYFYEKPISENISLIAKKFITRNAGKTRKHFVPILMCFTRSAAVRLASDCAGSNGAMFDERYFVTYEDTDLLTRMKKMNMKYAQSGSCFIWHHSKGTRDQLPSGYEQEGLRLFIEKWGFDPRIQEHTLMAKWKRKYYKTIEKIGLF